MGVMSMKATSVLTFTGDIGFDHHMARKWEDEHLLAPEVLAFLHDSDHVIANVEGPLVDPDAPRMDAAEQRLMHTIDPAAICVLQAMHADIWSLVNNHIMDAGQFGLSQTLQQAKAAGVRTLGVGMDLAHARKPLILDEAGGIGLLGVGYRRGCKPAGEDFGGCLLWNEMDIIREEIEAIKASQRWCIVVAHGGEEFTALPSPYTRDRYLAYLDMGADAVVSHHPHVPMNYEVVGGKPIFYSLGNFIFDTDYQRAQYHTDEGVVLKLRLSEDTMDFEAMGIRIDRTCEHVVAGPLPTIFTEVPADQYQLLSPLAAKMFVAATKRQQLFLYPERFTNATDEQWHEHFMEERRSGRVPGEGLDFQIICPLAEQAESGTWRQSTLEDVKRYILEQM